MDLQKLLDAMNVAKAALDKSPEDKALKDAYEAAKKAYDEAKAAADAGGDPEDESSWDDKTKAYIAKLRGESAKHRTKAKELASKLETTEAQKKAILKAAGIESEDDKPEEKLKKAVNDNHALSYRTAILEAAMEHGIAKTDVEYFSYLVEKRTAELKDDEELSDEAMGELVTEVKKRTGGGKANTSTGGGKGEGGKGSGNPPPEGGSGAVTLDQFCKMTFAEKSKLYGDNSALYNQLVNEAKAQNRLI